MLLDYLTLQGQKQYFGNVIEFLSLVEHFLLLKRKFNLLQIYSPIVP